MNNVPTEREILAESNEIFVQRKQASHHMGVIASEVSKRNHVDKSLLNRLKDYYLYQGVNWIGGNPLDLDPDSDTCDKVSPIFIRFLQVVQDLRAADCMDFLDPYIQALNNNGIKIYLDPGKVLVSDKQEVMDAVNSMGLFQKQINALNKELKIDKAEEADQISLIGKSDFPGLVSFYNKKEEKGNESVEDSYHSVIEKTELVSTAYTKVFDEALS
jgi:hypothetical protein